VARPEALDWSIDNCTVQRALQVVGDRWSFVVLREVFNGIRRFDDMRQRTAIPRQVLSDRLGRLVDEEILRRHPYREDGQRARYEYRLTPKGFDLYPILVALNAWGSSYYADAAGPPLVFRHRECDAEVHLELRCADGHEVGDLHDVVSSPGPGARRRTAS
jgi:DNA-binding HxlR family transcriptional regulator